MRTTVRSDYTMVEGLTDEEYGQWLDAWQGAFGSPPSGDPGLVSYFRGTHPPERCLLISDDRGPVATNTSMNRDFVLPGGATVPLAGCTGGSCHQTLRRTGLMRATLDRLHDRAVEEDVPLAAGGVSEWPIYRRFGYGPATWYDSVEIDIHRTGFRDDAPGDAGSLTRLSGPEARATAMSVYAQAASSTPGEVIPPDAAWDRLLLDPEDAGPESMMALGMPGGPLHCVGIEGRAFLSYRLLQDWTDQQAPRYTALVVDLAATDTEAEASVWRYLFSLDMVAEVHAWRLPQDSPLRWWVKDARWIRTVPKDGLWLRPLDVPRLLEARLWQGSHPGMSIKIHDPQGYTTGTYRMEVVDGKARCDRTPGAEPDLVMEVGTLGSIYLGGTSATGWARAGAIRCATPELAVQWDMLATPPRAPFISYWF
ncbi:GNAT family N-acetyltransferase [Myceligenerans indicum]|uniref:GNAT family N-acetyltransferase n=1 Tax=Myceligenerans indicum TaxID=2593663 RepID=A0ABS1LJ78_9MICO|nr:GNAT family N-acetyltransferase [Myceligenerans indicum]MBL0885617.1 GNAT family N-acetyltransferase [Myceligenerans indicum]